MKPLSFNVGQIIPHSLGLSILLATGLALPSSANAQGYSVTNLVADTPGVAANTDTNLQNAWGMVVNKKGIVVNANATSLAGAYGLDGTPTGDYIGVDSDPSGLIQNSTGGFKISNGSGNGKNKNKGKASTLIFVTEDGGILGFNSKVDSANAIKMVDNPSTNTVYKGVAVLNNKLFAANFFSGLVEVYDSKWNFIGSFTDTNVDAGFAPFNVVAIDGLLYVTFAKQLLPDMHDDDKGPGNGFVSVFNSKGKLQHRLIAHGALNSPWGMAKAPKNFGKFSKALLIGNFGDGTINAYDQKTGAFLGTLSDAGGVPLNIDGLWALEFGTTKASKNKSTPTLFFSAGPNGEADGLVGKINAN
jgi:uncharacterized protein (TIGR03118 family)